MNQILELIFIEVVDQGLYSPLKTYTSTHNNVNTLSSV